jgi:hypothetical protein
LVSEPISADIDNRRRIVDNPTAPLTRKGFMERVAPQGPVVPGIQKVPPKADAELCDNPTGSRGSRVSQHSILSLLDSGRGSLAQQIPRVEIPPRLAEATAGPAGQIVVDRVAQDDFYMAEGPRQAHGQVAVPRVEIQGKRKIAAYGSQIRTEPFRGESVAQDGQFW